MIHLRIDTDNLNKKFMIKGMHEFMIRVYHSPILYSAKERLDKLKKDQPDQQSKIIGNESIKLCLYELPDLKFTKGINHIGFHIENFDEIVEKCKTLKISMPCGVIEWESSRSVYNRSEWIRGRNA
jgi:hypothetical protein